MYYSLPTWLDSRVLHKSPNQSTCRLWTGRSLQTAPFSAQIIIDKYLTVHPNYHHTVYQAGDWDGFSFSNLFYFNGSFTLMETDSGIDSNGRFTMKGNAIALSRRVVALTKIEHVVLSV